MICEGSRAIANRQPALSAYAKCPICGKIVFVTRNNTLRTHEKGER